MFHQNLAAIICSKPYNEWRKTVEGTRPTVFVFWEYGDSGQEETERAL
jgi:hypothetical protein